MMQKTEEIIENKWNELKTCVRKITEKSVGIERNLNSKKMTDKQMNAKVKWLQRNNIVSRRYSYLEGI